MAIDQFLKIKDGLSSHDYAAIVGGHVSCREHHFYDWQHGGAGEKDLTKTLGANFVKHAEGKRAPSNVQNKNPILAPPTVTAQKFFGQSPLFKVAMDQLLAKRVGVFSQMVGGAGGGAFNMSNMAMFKGSMSLMDLVSKTAFGSTIQEGSRMFNQLQSMATKVGGIMGSVPITQMVNVSSAHDLQNIMHGISNTFSGIENTFNKSLFTDGVAFAKDVQEHIKRHY